MINILIVLEGERTETDFFNSLLQRFDLQAKLCVVGTNLYTLYHKCKQYNFDCDVKDVLKELVDESTKKLLEQKFTYTYLVFDADLHHKKPEQRGQSIPIEVLIKQNFPQLIEMAQHFTDETDPSIGRLYINYPMMESYRYCDKFDDDNYLSATISIAQMGNFKRLASQMNLSGIKPSEYKRTDFSNLIRMNIKRLQLIATENLNSNLPYYLYKAISEAASIASNQYASAEEKQELHVINTSLFIILDYFGNRNNFYDHMISYPEKQVSTNSETKALNKETCTIS